MIQFTKPTNLNGTELLAELNAGGVSITESAMIDGEGNFWLDIAEADKAKATPIVASHNGTTVTPDKSAEKAALLAKLGISQDDLTTLLS